MKKRAKTEKGGDKSIKKRKDDIDIFSDREIDLYSVPARLEPLLSFFEILDKVFCMAIKCHLDPTVEMIAKLVPPQGSFSMDNLLLLCGVTQANKAASFYLSLVYQPKPDGTVNLELCYSALRGNTAAFATRRMKCVRSALIKHTLCAHEAFLLKMISESECSKRNEFEKWDYSTGKLHSLFDLQTIPLPTPISLPVNSTHTGHSYSTISTSTKSLEEVVGPQQRLPQDGVSSIDFEHNPKYNSGDIVSSIMSSPQYIAVKAVKAMKNGDGEMDVVHKHDDDNGHADGDDDEGKALVDRIKSLEFYSNQFVASHTFAPRVAQFSAGCPRAIHPLVWDCLLGNTRVKALYCHQSTAIDLVANGRHLAISTSTASGKSLIYNLPVLSGIMKYRSGIPSSYPYNCNSRPTAIYIFPTKALAQDQLRALNKLCGIFPELSTSSVENQPQMHKRMDVNICIVDGDTSQSDRELSLQADIILTNPDTLHYYLLPNQRKFSEFLRGLKFVVLDEVHIYSGAFGGHVGMIMRRLVRSCLALNACPQFICCSATICNPAEHASKLVPFAALAASARKTRDLFGCPHEAHYIDCNDEPAVVGDEIDTSSRGHQTLSIWNPPLKLHQQQNQHIHDLNQCQGKAQGQGFHVGDEQEIEKPKTIANVDMICSTASSSIPIEGFTCQPPCDKLSSNRSCSTTATITSNTTSTSTTTTTTSRDANGLDAFLAGCEDRPITFVESSEHGDDSTRVGGRLRWGKRMELLAKESEPSTSTTNIISDQGKLINLSSYNGDGDGSDNSCGGGSEKYYEQRISAIIQTALLFTAFVKMGKRVLTFCNYRKLSEMVLRYALQDLHATAPSLVSRIGAYRGGYSKEERRTIEQELFNGKLLGVTATSALEIGVDVGNIDVVLHCGFPGSFTRFRQQIGRAGRSNQASLSIMVAFDSPLDQYFVRQPGALFFNRAEALHVSIENDLILYNHVLCATAEGKRLSVFSTANSSSDNSGSSSGFLDHTRHMGFIKDGDFAPEEEVVEEEVGRRGEIIQLKKEAINITNDMQLFGPALFSILSDLKRSTRFIVTDNKDGYIYFQCMSSSSSFHLARNVSIRDIDESQFTLIDVSKNMTAGYTKDKQIQVGISLDTIPYSRAFFELYEGAIYIHRGKQYLIHRLDLGLMRAYAKPTLASYYTKANSNTSVIITNEFTSSSSNSSSVRTGRVLVSSHVWGMSKFSSTTGALIEQVECPELPECEYNTTAVWFNLSSILGVSPSDRIARCAIAHAASHALTFAACLVAQCSTADISCVHSSGETTTAADDHRILLYDARQGGLGISDMLRKHCSLWVTTALQLLVSCPCANGCPLCLFDNTCPLRNRHLHKKGAILLLREELSLIKD